MALSPARRERLNLELTLFDLYRTTRIQVSRLSLIERQLVEPRPDEAKRIGKALGVDPDILFASVAAGQSTGSA